jgi:hypothetical protein
VAVVLTALSLGGCGGTDAPETTSEAALADLQLTTNPPAGLGEACAKVAPRTQLNVVCPPIAPTGDFTVQFLAPDVGAKDRSFYDVQVESASLHREGQNPGHWSFGAATTLPAVERMLKVSPFNARLCRRYNNQHANSPEQCEPEVSDLDVDGTAVKQYLMPDYPIGGINGGHVAFVWQGADAAYILSVHDPANRDRALVMLDGLMKATT